MATAKMHDGRAIVAYNTQGEAIDANGAVIDGAPKAPKDTPRELQPGSTQTTPEERMAIAIASALKGSAKAKTGTDESDDEEHDGLPTLGDLPKHLEGLSTVEDVKALQKTDKRVGAKPLYAARLAELKK